MDSLNIIHANTNPKVTENMDKIIKFISELIAKDFAYESEGDVYFKVKKFKDYGKLSGRNIDELKIGARVDINLQKDDALDFALWKKAKENEPSWDSPWGKGRPGWHIECSVLSIDNLGETLDIHGGGADLIFPHHENEIAQSEALTGKKFSNFWIHNGFVMINKEKMSKSLGNFFSLRDVLKKYDPMILRLFLLTQHYRKPLDFSDDKLEENKKRLEKFLNFSRHFKSLNLEQTKIDEINQNLEKFSEIIKIKTEFIEAMNDDFNTALAIAELHKLLELANKFKDLDENKMIAAWIMLQQLADVLGLKFEIKETENSSLNSEDDKKIQNLIDERIKARSEKNWAESDRLRDILAEMGIEIKDTKNGTEWRRK